VIQPARSVRNLTPSSTPAASPEDGIAGLAELPKIVHGQVSIVKLQLKSEARGLPAASLIPPAPPSSTAVYESPNPAFCGAIRIEREAAS